MEQRGKVVILDELEKIGNLKRDESSKKFGALKRKYYRWREQYLKESIGHNKWPNQDFFYFIAFISIKYEKIRDEYFVLKEVEKSDPTISNILKLGLNPHIHDNSTLVRLTNAFKNAQRLKGKDREENLQKLVGENYLPAIKAYCDIISDRVKEKYVLQGAILGDKDFISKRGWKAYGFSSLRLEVCARHTKLRVQENMLSSSYNPISQGSIIKSFSFTIKDSGEKWFELYSQLKGKKLSDCKYLLYDR